MSNEIGYLAKLTTDMQYLKALMGRIAAASGVTGTAGVPAVDFAVDMFDRGDQPVLDGYWDTNGIGWAIRNHQLVAQGAPVASVSATIVGAISSQLTTSGGGFQSNITGATAEARTTVLVNGLQTSFLPAANAQTLYLGKLSTPDVNVKITFDLPGEPKPSSYSPAQAPNVVALRTKIYISSNVAAVFGDAANRKLGVSVMAQLNPNGVTDSATGTYSFNYFATIAAAIATTPLSLDSVTPTEPGFAFIFTVTNYASAFFTDYSSFSRSIATPPTGSTFGTVISTTTYGTVDTCNTVSTISASAATGTQGVGTTHTVPSVLPVIQTGNVLLIQAQGDSYQVILNGSLIFSETGAYMARTRVGIGQALQSTLSGFISNGVTPVGITAFKAWPIGQSEPPDQTGRGTYAGGYSDKYHTTASNGAVTYNPLA